MDVKNNLKQINFKNSNINVLYYNDLHGATKNLESFGENQDEFYKEHDNEVNYTIAGGDVFADTNKKNETVAKKLNARTDVFGPGNHDFDGGNYLSNLIHKYNMKNKWVGSNLFYTKPTPLKKDIKNSIIIKKGKEQIGVIGVAPFDLEKVIFKNKNNNFVKVKPLDETIEGVKKEVAKLEKKGINKIFLLAHTGGKGVDGTKNYDKLAQIGGIDVIIGGHDHLETDEWKTSNRGEPVKIVATGESEAHEFGQNLDYIGILNLKFDDDGILIKEKTQNEFKNIISQKSDGEEKDLTLIKIIQAPVKIGTPINGHSEMGNLIADADLWYVNQNTTNEADFAFVNAGTIRDTFKNTHVTRDDIENTNPFVTPTLIKVPLTKKQIINTLNWCAKSTTYSNIPGMMQVSGMEYTVKPDLTVSDVHILNKDGSIKYNLDDCDDDDKFSAVYDTFLATAPAGLNDLQKDIENDKDIESFSVNRQTAMEEYLKNNDTLADYSKVRINTKAPVTVNK